jgi:SOS response regulatory protein OraA/RecX
VVVTALRELPRSRVEVELDGRAWRVLPIGAVVRAGLAVGRPLDRETARALARELRRARALDRATRALASRDRSRHALEQRLDRAGVTRAAREDTLAALEQVGLIDDLRVARTRAAAMAQRGYGDAAIRADLARAGVPRELAVEAVAELAPERERARDLVARSGAGPRELRRLAARGFDRDTLDDVAAFAGED